MSDFAYFGSCSELVRSSINDILELFPGELYAPYDNNSAFTHTIETVIFTSDTQYEGTVTTTTAYYYTEKDAIEAGYTGDTDTWHNIGKIGGTKKNMLLIFQASLAEMPLLTLVMKLSVTVRVNINLIQKISLL